MWPLIRQSGQVGNSQGHQGVCLVFSSFIFQSIHILQRKLGCVALNFDEEMASSSDAKCAYELPDGRVIEIGKERFKCGEVLFQPSLLGLEYSGVHESVNTAILNSDNDIRKELYMNIVVSGGSTLFPGFADRLQTEMFTLASASTRLRVIAPPERSITTWLGGSILASLPKIGRA